MRRHRVTTEGRKFSIPAPPVPTGRPRSPSPRSTVQKFTSTFPLIKSSEATSGHQEEAPSGLKAMAVTLCLLVAIGGMSLKAPSESISAVTTQESADESLPYITSIPLLPQKVEAIVVVENESSSHEVALQEKNTW